MEIALRSCKKFAEPLKLSVLFSKQLGFLLCKILVALADPGHELAALYQSVFKFKKILISTNANKGRTNSRECMPYSCYAEYVS